MTQDILEWTKFMVDDLMPVFIGVIAFALALGLFLHAKDAFDAYFASDEAGSDEKPKDALSNLDEREWWDNADMETIHIAKPIEHTTKTHE